VKYAQNGGSSAEYECRGRTFVGSARREVLDHVLLVDDQHLASLLRQYQSYFNESRPHQGLGQLPTGD
jgi:transposase InsO family protein